jgi:hypothetical protein
MSPPPGPSTPSTPVDAAPLDHLADITSQIRELEHEREITICAAIDAGTRWPDIAASLGVTTQAAHKRYRWLRRSTLTGETWHEPPLPSQPTRTPEVAT